MELVSLMGGGVLYNNRNRLVTQCNLDHLVNRARCGKIQQLGSRNKIYMLSVQDGGFSPGKQ